MRAKRHAVVVICLLFSITGCVPTAELYIGKQVTDAPIVQLEEGANVSGTWQTFDMTINYRYQTDGDLIDLAGQGQLSQHYQLMYNGVRSMQVYLFLLDADGLVLETMEIPAFLISTEDRFTFSKPFKASEKVNGFSFGYRGEATEMEGHAYFDNLPSKAAR